jgi:N-methylhydantoinase A
MNVQTCRIGIDVGGTFTDFVLADRATGRLVRYKEPSVPSDPSLSVERGIPALLARAGVTPAQVELVVHGTTLALNAIIQRRGAKLGLVVSRGNRGVLEIGRAQLPSAFSYLLEKEPPLVPRALVREVSARLDPHGSIVAEATAEELDAIAAAFSAEGVASVTVLLFHAYANPEFEQALAQSLRARLPSVAVTPSAAIWPERREYERCLVALMNAYVEPMMTDYLARLAARVQGLGITAPLYITSNNGGTLSIDTARARPIDTILSGPASGVVAAAATAGRTQFGNVITVDMGGTSADMSIVQALEPAQTTRTTVGNLPIIVPVVAVSAIGAGGGSVVWVDAQGMLKVGPHSAGAFPGPACYGQGGTEAAITDCYLLAGCIDPDNFLGGRLKLDARAATTALTRVADRLGMKGDDRAIQVARAALRITAAMMGSDMARDLAQKGEDARDYALMPFGGAGPTHALLVAEEIGISRVIVPATPSTFCALGAILADVKRDFVASRFLHLKDQAALPALAHEYDRLESTARTWIAQEGDILGATNFEATADCRYEGQAFDLPVRLPDALRRAPDAAAITALFHEVHEKLYSFRDPDSPVEITTQRLRVTGTIPPVTLPNLAPSTTQGTPTGHRTLHLDDGPHKAPVWRRDSLAPGQILQGPVIIEQEDTTTVIPPSWQVTVDSIGNLLVVGRKSEAPSATATILHADP